MTESEARGYIQGKLNCMNKCGVFERVDKLKYNKNILLFSTLNDASFFTLNDANAA